jgi:class 3 adenylate cyclase
MGESQTATILVSDLVGSTELRVRLGEEEADRLRRVHDALLATAVEGNNGRVVKGLGDGVLAMFESAADAVSAGVAIQQAAFGHARTDPDRALDIRIGISAGDISVEDGDCFGTPVVEASRLCAVANGGQILVADLVRLLARGRGGHVFVASGDRELKGLPEPVAVAVVDWQPPDVPEAVVPFPPQLVAPAQLPFAGRHRELEALTQAWKQASVGERRLVFLAGEPGIGKTRLASELARAAHESGAAVLYGRCDEGMGVPFQPFVEALELVVSAGVDRDALGRLPGELARLAPELSSLIPGIDEPLRSDPETERYRLFDAVASWLSTLATDHGLVLVLDDVQWAEKATLLLVRHLTRSADLGRVLVIATYRDTDVSRGDPLVDVLADLRREPCVERIPLTGLDVEGVTDLLSAAAGGAVDDRAQDLAQALWNETEGNPFFVGEIVRNLVESGAVVQRDGVWTSDLDVAELAIPEGVREVVGRRLSRLSEPANALLATAAVIGSVFDLDLVATVSGIEEDDALDALDEACAAALLRESAAGRYEFTHALVKSTLYEELSATRRGRRHRQIADAMEARGTDDVAALAYHYARSGPADMRAVEYAVAAGDRALDALAPEEAVAFFTQAVELLEAAGDDGIRGRELKLRLGIAQRDAGDPAHRETLLEAARDAMAAGDTTVLASAAIANQRGTYSVPGGIDPERLEVIEAALEAVGSADSIERVELLSVASIELFWMPHDPRRLGYVDEAVAMANRLGDDAAIAGTAAARLLAASPVHDAPALLEAEPAVLDALERLGDPRRTATVRAFLAVTRLTVGDAEAFRGHVAAVASAASRVSQPAIRILALHTQNLAAGVDGRLDDIERTALEAFELAQESGASDALLNYVVELVGLRLDQGRAAEIADVVTAQGGDHPGIKAFQPAVACVLAHAGRNDEARVILDQLAANDFTFARDLVWQAAMAFAADACIQLGAVDLAPAIYEQLEPYRDTVVVTGLLFTRFPVAHHLGGLARLLGWHDRAEEHLRHALAIEERIGAPLWAATTRRELASAAR